MHAKLLLIIILFLSIGCANQSQNKTDKQNEISALDSNNLNELFKIDLTNYFNAFNNRNWDLMTAMIYPKLFEFTSKEEMLQVFVDIEEMGMNMSIDLNEINKLSKIFVDGDLQFCRVFYRALIQIKLRGMMLENQSELAFNFQEQYGSENVTYNDEVFSINVENSMIAVSDLDTKNWTYMEYNEDPASLTLLQSIIPEAIFNDIID
ncbi:MAG: hypothetical protein CMP62_02265 [Flavobacteriales bacterium]|nr:hypothetical protein [Flavobacteriales bacterium]